MDTLRDQRDKPLGKKTDLALILRSAQLLGLIFMPPYYCFLRPGSAYLVPDTLWLAVYAFFPTSQVLINCISSPAPTWRFVYLLSFFLVSYPVTFKRHFFYPNYMKPTKTIMVFMIIIWNKFNMVWTLSSLGVLISWSSSSQYVGHDLFGGCRMTYFHRGHQALENADIHITIH